MDTKINTPSSSQSFADPGKQHFGWGRMLLIIFATIIITVLVTVWVVKTVVFPSEFTPVSLSSQEEEVLSTKLDTLGISVNNNHTQDKKESEGAPGTVLQPERYSEKNARRDISFSEKELNALLAKNTDLARKLAVDLSNNLVSARLLVPMDEDFPMLGGRVLKVNAGVELAYENNKPIVVIKGVSVMGVPIPNAWLGGFKNIDLVQQFGADEGFWNSFADGVEDIHIEEGSLKVKLKE